MIKEIFVVPPVDEMLSYAGIDADLLHGPDRILGDAEVKLPPIFTARKVLSPPPGIELPEEQQPRAQGILWAARSGLFATTKMPAAYDGPAAIALQVLQELTTLVSVMLFSHQLDEPSDRLLAAAAGEEDERDGAALQLEFMSFQQMLNEHLGAPPYDPRDLLVFLRKRVCCQYWRVSLILRLCMQSALSEGDQHSFAELERWISYTDGRQQYTSGGLVVPLPAARDEKQAITRLLSPHGNEKREGKGWYESERVGHPMLPLHVVGRRDVRTRDFWDPTPLAASNPIPVAPALRFLMSYHSQAPGADPDEPPGDSVFPEAPRFLYPPFVEGHRGLVEYETPEPRLWRLQRAMLGLREGDRKCAEAVGMQIDFRVEQAVEGRDAPKTLASALEAEGELLLTLLLREQLKWVVVPARCRCLPATSKSELRELETHYREHFLIPAAEAAADSDPARRVTGIPHENVADDRARARHELRAALQHSQALAVSMHKTLLSSSLLTVARAQASLASFAALQDASDADSKDLEKLPPACWQKIDLLLEFLNRLRQRSATVKLLQGGKAYLLMEKDIDESAGELARRLTTWHGHFSTTNLPEDLASQLKRLSDELHEQGIVMKEQAVQMASLKEQRHAQMCASVAEKGHRLLHEVDRLRRVIRVMHSAAREMEHRLASDTKRQLIEELAAWRQQVEEVRENFRAYEEALRENVVDEVEHKEEDLKRDLLQLSESTGVFPLQHFAQKLGKADKSAEYQDHHGRGDDYGAGKNSSQDEEAQLVSRGMQDKLYHLTDTVADAAQLRSRVAQLEADMLKSKMFAALKHVTMQSKYEQKLRELIMTQISNGELWGRLTDVSGRELLERRNLVQASHQVSEKESRVENLRDDVQREQEAKQKLQLWKKAKTRWLTDLEERMNHFKRIGMGKIEDLVLEAQAVQEEIDLLQARRKPVETERAGSHSKVLRLREEVRQSDAVGAEEFSRLQDYREQFDTAAMGEEELVAMWQGRCKEMENQLRAEKDELQDLEMEARALGLRGDQQDVNQLEREQWRIA